MVKLADYLARRRVLIADPNTSSRVGLAKALVDLGAKMSQITLVDSFAWAEETVHVHRPEIIVSEFKLGTRSALELFDAAQRATSANSTLGVEHAALDHLHVIVTGNSSQATVAQAAEGDVDVYISKPYSLEVLKQALTEAISTKLEPSPYLRTIDQGRALLARAATEQQIAQAIRQFEQARSMHDRPALACYYIGYAHTLNRALEIAQSSYQQGLEYNRVHLKCLLGLFDALERQGKHTDAYQVFKRVVGQFPISPHRLSQALKLAVITMSLDDIEEYYRLFKEIDARDEALVRHMCAALVVLGKQRLRSATPANPNSLALALDAFRKASITAGARLQFVSEIITALAEAGFAQEADTFLKRIPQEQRESADYLALDYLVLSRLKPLPVRLDHGRRLVRSGHFHPMIYRLLIEATAQAGLRDTAENLIVDARKLWPDFRAPDIALNTVQT